MNWALGYILKNEEFMLEQTLRPIRKEFDGIIACDTGSTDRTKAVLAQYKAHVFDFDWQHDFSAARNAVIAKAEGLGFDALLMLDADEVMFARDIALVKTMLWLHPVLKFPRYNFVSANSVSVEHYPDYQTRAFMLHQGAKYGGVVHESLNKGATTLLGVHIFHYGWLKPSHEVWLKNHNYALVTLGKTPLAVAPSNMVFEKPFGSPFHAPQPIAIIPNENV